jgi:UDP-galactose transporter B1
MPPEIPNEIPNEHGGEDNPYSFLHFDRSERDQVISQATEMVGRRNNTVNSSSTSSISTTVQVTAPLHVEDIESHPLTIYSSAPAKRTAYRRNELLSGTESTVSSTSTDDTHIIDKPLPVSQRQVSRLLFGAAGIYGAYLYYGHIQEDLFKYRSIDGSSFHAVWLLQTLESAANIVVGVVGRRVFGGRANLSLRPFFTTGVSQVFSKALTSLALAAGLSFPICILAKSAKIVPVMIGQLVLGGSQYTFRDCLFAALIVGGTAFLSAGSKKQKDENNSTPMGLLFILLSLVMDGVTAGLQKRLKRTYSTAPPTTYDFLLFTNLSMGAVAFTISLGTLDMAQGLSFLEMNPAVARMVLKVCICSAIGQSFIFFVVATFDPMVCSTITTTRKMLSVLWSVVSKGHELSGQGSVGLALAMSGLLLEVQGKITRMGKESSSVAASNGKTAKSTFLSSTP